MSCIDEYVRYVTTSVSVDAEHILIKIVHVTAETDLNFERELT